MEPKIKSSFIPKTPVTSSSPAPRKRGSGGGGVFFTLSLIVFLLALAGWVGIFGYNIYLERTIENKSVLLEEERAAFAPSLIEELKRLDTRLIVAEDLLNAHLAPSILFDIISQVTLRTVQFDGMEYTWLPDGRISLSLEGTARNFASLALQADALADEDAIRDPIFSDFGLDEFGNVTFVVEAQVNPLELSYVDLVARRGTPITPEGDALTPDGAPAEGGAEAGEGTPQETPESTPENTPQSGPPAGGGVTQ